jgi:hypothetical protein
MGVDQPDEDRLRHLARASSLALDPTVYADVPTAVVAELRSVCLGLPESVEKQVWAGTQWRVRNRMYAHVLTALRSAGHPFFRPAWGANLVGMVLDADVNWDEVTELVIESYCALAPRKLVEQIDRPAN